MFIHINSHFAIGVIFTSILHYFFDFSLIEFLLIIIFSFICDFDVFFSKYAEDHNHRMLISHSIIPSILMILLGIIINWLALVFSGLAYFIHIVIDTFDWGTNVFYFPKKQVGLKLLISKEEFKNINKYLTNYKKSESFFDAKYYSNRTCLSIEVIIFILMIVCLLFFAIQYIWVTILYFPFLYFHLDRHFRLKKIESS